MIEFASNSEYSEVTKVTYSITEGDIHNIQKTRRLLEPYQDLILKIVIYLEGNVECFTENNDFTISNYYIDVYCNSQYIKVVEKYTNEIITIPITEKT